MSITNNLADQSVTMKIISYLIHQDRINQLSYKNNYKKKTFNINYELIATVSNNKSMYNINIRSVQIHHIVQTVAVKLRMLL